MTYDLTPQDKDALSDYPKTSRKSRAYHISQEAIAVCNRLDLDPSESILQLDAEVEKRAAFIDVKKAMREVIQVEGVTLRAGDKEMLQKCFDLVIREIKKDRTVPDTTASADMHRTPGCVWVARCKQSQEDY